MLPSNLLPLMCTVPPAASQIFGFDVRRQNGRPRAPAAVRECCKGWDDASSHSLDWLRWPWPSRVRARFPPKMGRIHPPNWCINVFSRFFNVFAMYLRRIVGVIFEAFRRLVSLCIGQVSVRYRLSCLEPSCALYSIHAPVSTFLDTKRYILIHD